MKKYIRTFQRKNYFRSLIILQFYNLKLNLIEFTNYSNTISSSYCGEYYSILNIQKILLKLQLKSTLHYNIQLTVKGITPTSLSMILQLPRDPFLNFLQTTMELTEHIPFF